MFLVVVSQEAGLDLGLFEGAPGGGGEDEQGGTVAQRGCRILHRLFLCGGTGFVLKTDDIGARRLQLDFHLVALNRHVQPADAMLMGIGGFGGRADRDNSCHCHKGGERSGLGRHRRERAFHGNNPSSAINGTGSPKYKTL